MAESRRAYRYKVVDKGGAGVKAVGESPYVIDWKYLGKTYDWQIYDFSKGAEHIGFIAGEFVDKGYMRDGQYEPDGDTDA